MERMQNIFVPNLEKKKLESSEWIFMETNVSQKRKRLFRTVRQEEMGWEEGDGLLLEKKQWWVT